MTSETRSRLDRGHRLVLLSGLVCFLGFLMTSPIGDIGPLEDLYRGRQLLITVLQWVCFGIAVLGLRRAARLRNTSLVLLVLIAAACQLPGLMSAPRSSNDAYRYVWDGRVQLAGISPYRYVPLDDELARLRDPVLFPGLPPDQPSGVRTPATVPTDPAQLQRLLRSDSRIAINRPGVPTIYPPVAQAWFTGVAAVTPWSVGTRGLQGAAALLAITMTAGLGLVLRRRGRDPASAVYWGWSPVGVLETGNGAHVDVLAVAFILAAVILLDRPTTRTRVLGGILLGLAVATKILPLLLIPAVTVLRRKVDGGRQWLQVPIAAVGTAVISYLPHVLVAGSLVLGYLPGYLSEEGFSDGRNRYLLLSLVLPPALRQPVAFVLLLALSGWVLWRATPRRPECAALWMYGGSMLISTPQYPWYGLPLLGLIALAGRPEWLGVVVATQLAYIDAGPAWMIGGGYLIAGLLVLAGTWWRSGSSGIGRRAKSGPEVDRASATVSRGLVPTAEKVN